MFGSSLVTTNGLATACAFSRRSSAVARAAASFAAFSAFSAFCAAASRRFSRRRCRRRFATASVANARSLASLKEIASAADFCAVKRASRSFMPTPAALSKRGKAWCGAVFPSRENESSSSSFEEESE